MGIHIVDKSVVFNEKLMGDQYARQAATGYASYALINLHTVQ